MNCVVKLRERPDIMRLVEHFLEYHLPQLGEKNQEPVTMPRIIFDGLACAALAGLDAAEDKSYNPGRIVPL